MKSSSEIKKKLNLEKDQPENYKKKIESFAHIMANPKYQDMPEIKDKWAELHFEHAQYLYGNKEKVMTLAEVEEAISCYKIASKFTSNKALKNTCDFNMMACEDKRTVINLHTKKSS